MKIRFTIAILMLTCSIAVACAIIHERSSGYEARVMRLLKRRQAGFDRDVNALLDRRLASVEFEPGDFSSYKTIRVQDRDFLDQVGPWLRSLHCVRPDNSLRFSIYRLELAFEDGHVEEMRFSGTDRSEDEPTSMTLSWHGHHMCGSSQPFVDYLRMLHSAHSETADE